MPRAIGLMSHLLSSAENGSISASVGSGIFFVAACCGDELVNGKLEMLDILSSKSAFIFLAEVKFISRTLAYSTWSTYVGRSHEYFTCVHDNFPFIFVHASKEKSTLATCQYDSANPALRARQ